MIDEGTLKRNFPGIPWDQPVLLTVLPEWGSEEGKATEVWACRYCIALHGLKAQDILQDRVPEQTFKTRVEALDHVDRVHHA